MVVLPTSGASRQTGEGQSIHHDESKATTGEVSKCVCVCDAPMKGRSGEILVGFNVTKAVDRTVADSKLLDPTQSVWSFRILGGDCAAGPDCQM